MVTALLGLCLQLLLFILVLVVAVDEVSADDEFQSTEEDHDVRVWLPRWQHSSTGEATRFVGNCGVGRGGREREKW